MGLRKSNHQCSNYIRRENPLWCEKRFSKGNGILYCNHDNHFDSNDLDSGDLRVIGY